MSTGDHEEQIFIFMQSKLLWLQHCNFIVTFVVKQQKRTPSLENTFIH